MTTIVDLYFPPTDANSSPSMALDYSSFTYWRDPLAKIIDAADPTTNDENNQVANSDDNTKNSVEDVPATAATSSDGGGQEAKPL